MKNDLMYECVGESATGKEYNLCHHWRELKTFFGFIHAYQCENCGKKLSKKQFSTGNYHIYDKIKHL